MIDEQREHGIWAEKYRPVSLDTYIGNKDLKSKLANYISEQDIPHLLLSGPAGTGKSTAAMIIANSLDADVLYINASDENDVETVRKKIKGFASTLGFKSLKICVLDECLDEHTLVWVLRYGESCKIEIKDVDPDNDLVKTYNFEKNQIEWRPFQKADKGMQDVYEIEFENDEKVICSGTHKWYVSDSIGKIIRVPTTELYDYGTYSDIISPIENNIAELKIVSIKKLEGQHHLYDLSVPGTHNFYIGEKGILTSNCDYITLSGQAALRNLMEAYSMTCRFILTCNYIERMMDAIVSRCQVYHVTPPSKQEVALHIASILDKEDVTYDVMDIAEVVNLYYPDIRHIINMCQRFSVENNLKVKNTDAVDANYMFQIKEVLKSNKAIKIKFESIRQIIADADVRDFIPLYRYLYDSVDEIAPSSVASTIICIAEHQLADTQVVDKEINAMACIVKILNEL